MSAEPERARSYIIIITQAILKTVALTFIIQVHIPLPPHSQYVKFRETVRFIQDAQHDGGGAKCQKHGLLKQGPAAR